MPFTFMRYRIKHTFGKANVVDLSGSRFGNIASDVNKGCHCACLDAIGPAFPSNTVEDLFGSL